MPKLGLLISNNLIVNQEFLLIFLKECLKYDLKGCRFIKYSAPVESQKFVLKIYFKEEKV
jgi:hypothetical protein